LIVGGQSGTGTYNGVISVNNDVGTEVVRLDRTGLKAVAGKIANFVILTDRISSDKDDNPNNSNPIGVIVSTSFIKVGST